MILAFLQPLCHRHQHVFLQPAGDLMRFLIRYDISLTGTGIMVRISLHDHSFHPFQAIVRQQSVQIRLRGTAGITGNDKGMASRRQVILYLGCLLRREIGHRRKDKQKICVLRHLFGRYEVQILDLKILFLHQALQVIGHGDLIMAGQGVCLPQIFTGDIGNRAGNLTLPVEAGYGAAVGRVIHLIFVDLIRAQCFFPVAAFHDYTVII